MLFIHLHVPIFRGHLCSRLVVPTGEGIPSPQNEQIQYQARLYKGVEAIEGCVWYKVICTDADVSIIYIVTFNQT